MAFKRGDKVANKHAPSQSPGHVDKVTADTVRVRHADGRTVTFVGPQIKRFLRKAD